MKKTTRLRKRGLLIKLFLLRLGRRPKKNVIIVFNFQWKWLLYHIDSYIILISRFCNFKFTRNNTTIIKNQVTKKVNRTMNHLPPPFAHCINLQRQHNKAPRFSLPLATTSSPQCPRHCPCPLQHLELHHTSKSSTTSEITINGHSSSLYLYILFWMFDILLAMSNNFKSG